MNLLGIYSVILPAEERARIWGRLVSDLPLAKLETLMAVAPLSAIFDLAAQIVAGQIAGRVVIDVAG